MIEVEPTIRTGPPDAVILTIGQTLAAVMRMVAWNDVDDAARNACAPLPPAVASLFGDQSPAATEAVLRISGGAFQTCLTIEHCDAVESVNLRCTIADGTNRLQFPLPKSRPGLRIHTDENAKAPASPTYEGAAPSYLTRNLFGHLLDWLGTMVRQLHELDGVEVVVQLKTASTTHNLVADSRRGGWPNAHPQPVAPTESA